MSVILNAQNLNYHYGAVHAVRGVDVSVNAGEMLALIGPNGAGKSTVFALLNGDLTSRAARITLAGQEISRASVQTRTAAGLGRSYQTAAPFTTLTVRENLYVAATALPSKAEQCLQQLDEVLHGSGLAAQQHNYVSDLPYADWKRLDLALALVQQPCVLLLDEPTAGLAHTERIAMMEWLSLIANKQGVAILFTEHNLDAVFAYAQRITVLVRGRVLAQGTARDIAANSEVQMAYTGTYQLPVKKIL